MIGIAGNYSESFLNKLKSDLAKLPDTNPEIPSAPVVKMPDGIDVEIIAKNGALVPEFCGISFINNKSR